MSFIYVARTHIENHIGAEIRVPWRSACLSPSCFTSEKIKALKGKGTYPRLQCWVWVPESSNQALAPITCYLCYSVLALCSLGCIRDLNALSGSVGERELTERLREQEYYVTS